MKKIYISLSLIVVLISCRSSREVYLKNDFYTITSPIEKIAILPFQVRIEDRIGKNERRLPPKEDLQSELSESYQEGFYTYLLGELQRRKKRRNIAIQDASRTRRILQEKGIEFEDLENMTSGDICKILDVDAVVRGGYGQKQLMSYEASAAIITGTRIIETIVNRNNNAIINPAPAARSHEVSLGVSIYSNKNDLLLWRYGYGSGASAAYSVGNAADRLFTRAVRLFPYRTKKY